jgi:hypothetical protein
MSWFQETLVIPSEKNGTIIAKRHFGRWRVLVDDCEQTGSLVHEMWKNAFEKVKLHLGLSPIRKVLMVGLGGGGEIATINTYFGSASLTVIEYDEKMIDLAKTLRLYLPFSFPKVICSDAKEALPALMERFDLIIVDIFKGPEPSSLITDPAFIKNIEALLNRNGFLLVNAYRHQEYLEKPVTESLIPVSTWRFGGNHLGLYIKSVSGAGTFLPKDEWPMANPLASMPDFLRPATITGNPSGLYWRFWPASFELYRGDEEPKLTSLSKDLKTPFRVVMWQRIKRSDAPIGWQAFSDRPYRMIGFAKVHEEFEKHWSENARRMRRDWLAHYQGKKYTIETVTLTEFLRAYRKSTLPYLMRLDVADELTRREKNMEDMSLWAIRNMHTEELVAGIAILHSKEASSSYYIGGFYLKEVKHEPVMTGLFDHWFTDALQRKETFLDFGNFWKSGEPSSWKGFSRFKAKFSPSYFFYKPILHRFNP